jgi:hypothetical protein
MGLDKLSAFTIKFLQWLIGILLAVLTFTGAWSMSEIYKLNKSLPKEYVMVERYIADQQRGQIDQARTAVLLDRIDSKLDRLSERIAQHDSR